LTQSGVVTIGEVPHTRQTSDIRERHNVGYRQGFRMKISIKSQKVHKGPEKG